MREKPLAEPKAPRRRLRFQRHLPTDPSYPPGSASRSVLPNHTKLPELQKRRPQLDQPITLLPEHRSLHLPSPKLQKRLDLFRHVQVLYTDDVVG